MEPFRYDYVKKFIPAVFQRSVLIHTLPKEARKPLLLKTED